MRAFIDESGACIGSYAKRTAITPCEHVDIVPGNYVVIKRADPKQPVPKFYGGSLYLSDFGAVEVRDVSRVQRASFDNLGWLPLAKVAKCTLLFLSKQNRESF